MGRGSASGARTCGRQMTVIVKQNKLPLIARAVIGWPVSMRIGCEGGDVSDAIKAEEIRKIEPADVGALIRIAKIGGIALIVRAATEEILGESLRG